MNKPLQFWRELYEQRWPAPPQILIDAVREFGEARALELDRQARRRSRTVISYEDQLEMLVRQERVSRAVERANAERGRTAEPFSFRLEGWPRRWL